METEDMFSIMKRSNTNTKTYFEEENEPPEALNCGMMRSSTGKLLARNHRNFLPTPQFAAQKTDDNKMTQFTLVPSEANGQVKFASDEKLPIYEHGIYIPRRAADACMTAGKSVRLTPADKKRQERNTREQQRSCKISKQIDQLKELLHSSGFKMKKNSKSSVLAGVAEYVKELQVLSQEADRDIRRAIIESDTPSGEKDREKDSFLLDGDSDDFQYRNMFFSSPIPIALARINGSFFDCNRSFLEATRLTQGLFDKSTVFKLIDPSSLQAAHRRIKDMINSTSQLEHFFVRCIVRSDVGNGNPKGEAGFFGLSMISDHAFNSNTTTESDCFNGSRCLSVTFVPFDEYIR